MVQSLKIWGAPSDLPKSGGGGGHVPPLPLPPLDHACIWSSGCQTRAKKRAKNTKTGFLALFWAHVGQPDDHIGWATLMPLVSIYPTSPRTNPWKPISKFTWTYSNICLLYDTLPWMTLHTENWASKLPNLPLRPPKRLRGTKCIRCLAPRPIHFSQSFYEKESLFMKRKVFQRYRRLHNI